MAQIDGAGQQDTNDQNAEALQAALAQRQVTAQAQPQGGDDVHSHQNSDPIERRIGNSTAPSGSYQKRRVPCTQRRKRWKTLFQLPKSLGRSRQGTPVRTRHSTASRNSRLSLAVAPGSEALPGSSGAIFSPTASPTTNRDLSSIAPTPPKRRLKHDPSAGGILNGNRPVVTGSSPV